MKIDVYVELLLEFIFPFDGSKMADAYSSPSVALKPCAPSIDL